jgi:hypothetical protein
MAVTTSKTQQELNEAMTDIARVKEILDEAYTPESSREVLAAAIGEALDVLADYETDEDEDEEEEEESGSE